MKDRDYILKQIKMERITVYVTCALYFITGFLAHSVSQDSKLGAVLIAVPVVLGFFFYLHKRLQAMQTAAKMLALYDSGNSNHEESADS